MSENSSPEAKPPATSTPQTEQLSVSLNMSHAISLCAAGLLICFFLPWIAIFMARPSGFAFAKEGGNFWLLWSIPIFSVLTIIAGITKSSQKVIAQFTGAVPFFVLSYALYHNGKDLMHALDTGAYGSLVLGLALFILPRRLK